MHIIQFEVKEQKIIIFIDKRVNNLGLKNWLLYL